MKEEISVMYSEEVLNKKIGEMAEQISKEYAYLKAVSSFAVNWQKGLRCL